jgi:Cu(I)/Ag(I) efflux system protein CusF
MSMGFKVGDPKLLGKLKKGDKIQFTFVQSGRDYVITSVK